MAEARALSLLRANAGEDKYMTVKPYEWKGDLVRLEKVCWHVGERPILTNVTATVKDVVRPDCSQGQIVGILGPSGRGKSILSRILTGLLQPKSGSVVLVDGEATTTVAAGLVGYVPQNYPLLNHRTILKNLSIAARKAGVDRKTAEDKALEYLNMFDLADKRDVYPATLSGGQRQRIAIAQQLLCSEHFLVLDEPFTGLDPIMKDRVCDLITKVASLHEKNTIFLVAHDIAAVLAVADTLWLIGKMRTPSGASMGSSILFTYDLIERGIAWDPNSPSLPAFQSTLREVRARFEEL